MPVENIPRIASESFYMIEKIYEQARGDAIVAARGNRGNKAARTRLRVNLMKIIKLCRQARKDIPPAK
jgi:hypothetical protein